MAKKLKLWGPVFLWAGLIFFLSSLPDLKTDFKEDFFLRKAAHSLEYFIMTFLLFRAFKGTLENNESNINRLYMYPAAISLIYAASDEVHQSFVAGRFCSLNDVIIDSTGILIFYILLNLMKGKPCSIK